LSKKNLGVDGDLDSERAAELASYLAQLASPTIAQGDRRPLRRPRIPFGEPAKLRK
jgi:hypothetical protein